MSVNETPAEVLEAIAAAHHARTDRVFSAGDRRWRVCTNRVDGHVLVFERRVGRKWLRWSDTEIGDAVRKVEAAAVPCDHTGETTTRTAHGYLGDAPKGTVETLCANCGTVLASATP